MNKIRITDEEKSLIMKFMNWAGMLPYVELSDTMEFISKIEDLGYDTMIQYRSSADGKFHQLTILKDNNIIAETLEDMEWIENAEKYSKHEAMFRGVINFLKKHLV